MGGCQVSRYKAMAQELYPVSRRLAKKLENYLQEMQDHAILQKSGEKAHGFNRGMEARCYFCLRCIYLLKQS